MASNTIDFKIKITDVSGGVLKDIQKSTSDIVVVIKKMTDDISVAADGFTGVGDSVKSAQKGIVGFGDVSNKVQKQVKSISSAAKEVVNDVQSVATEFTKVAKAVDGSTQSVQKVGEEFDNSAESSEKLKESVQEIDETLDQTSESAERTGDAFKEAASSAFRFNQIREVLQGALDVLDKLTAPAQQFNQAMREANTMAGKGEADFRRLKDSVAGLSQEIPIARDLLAKGLYQTISNGVPEDNWLTFLEQSAKSAVGGVANLEKVVTVTSTVIKNYGLEWSAAGEIQDKIQTTAKNGVTSFEQLADALPRVSGNAATLGVSVDDLLATFATLTGVSGNTAEVSTQLAAVFTALIKPSSEAAKMAAQMGVSFDAVSIKASGGLIPFLQNLSGRIQEYSAKTGVLEQEIYGMMFGSAEALRAVIPLTGELGSKFVENSELMVSSSGAINAAFNEINSTGDSTSQRLSNWASGFSDLAVSIMGTSVPYVTFAAQTGMIITQLIAFYGLFKSGAIKGFIASIVTSKTVLALKSTALGVAAIASKAYQYALNGLTISLHSAKIATVALWGAITLGASLVIQAVIEVISRLTNSVEENTEVMTQAQQAEQRYRDILVDARSEMKLVIADLATFNGSKDDEARKVAELNSKYKESFGCYETISDWYTALVSKSDLYCRSILNEAKTRAKANKLAQDELELESYGSGDNLSGVDKTRYIAQKAIVDMGHLSLKSSIAEGATIKRDMAKPNASGDSKINAKDIYGDIIDSQSELKSLQGKGSWSVDEISRINALNAKIPELASKYKSLTGVDLSAKPTVAKKGNIETKPVIDFSKIKADVDKNTKELFVDTFGYIDFYPPQSDLSLQELDEAISYYRQKILETKGDERLNMQGALGLYDGARSEIENNLAISALPKDPKSLGDFDSIITSLMTKRNEASEAELVDIDREIEAYKRKRNAMEQGAQLAKLPGDLKNLIGIPSDLEMVLQVRMEGVEVAKAEIQRLQELMTFAQTDEERKGIETVIGGLKEYVGVAGDVTEKGESNKKVFSGISSIMSSLSGVVDDSVGAWLSYFSNIVSTIPTLIAAFGGLAAAEAASSVASIPYVGPIVAAAAVVSTLAAIATIPKFADGGIAYGTTLGVFGEYSGAANNPEVVAPLDKLRSLIEPQGGVGGQVEFRIDGRVLVGMLNKMNKIKSRV